MKKLLILIFSILISFNSYGETKTDYYENGQIMSEADLSDDGTHTSWYKGGQIEEETNYKDGKYDGKWALWYANGYKKWEGNYKDGVLTPYF